MNIVVKLIVMSKNSTDVFEVESGSNLLQVLREKKIYIPALCSGNGTCGKCRVKINGTADITAADKKIFSDDMLQSGFRLACKVVLEEDMIISLPEGEDEMMIESGGTLNKQSSFSVKKENEGNCEKEYFIAVDIGTTTIAMALVDYEEGEIQEVYTTLNHQRAFGADVISRIAAANKGKLAQLHQLVEHDLFQGVRTLIEDKIDAKQLKKVVIAGNTTMMHLLMGYSCESLGHHPFHSDYLGQYDGMLYDCIEKEKIEVCGLEHVKLMLFPGVSAFVGGDIVAGMQVCHEFYGDKLTFLLDLGTNGEMVFGNKDRLLCTSAAAGPAFEGGNITCGTGSIPGAVSMVKIHNRKAIVKTISDSRPVTGICGTGIVSAIAQLKLSRIMDKEGKLQFPFDKKGFPLQSGAEGENIALYQQDIRQFQMAKGAIRTGVEQLIETYGCKFEEVEKVYLAGGFGTRLSVDDAIETGILPREFSGKVEAIGNGALYGCIFYEMQEKKRDLNLIARNMQHISLAMSEGFQDKYLVNMNFYS